MPRLSASHAVWRYSSNICFQHAPWMLAVFGYHPVEVKKDGVVLVAGDHTSAHGLSHRSSPPRIPALVDERSVPDLHGGYSPVVAEDTQRSRIQQKVLTAARGQSDPSRHEHAQHVSVREQRDVAVDRARAGYHPVHPRTDLLRRLAARAAIPKEQPTRRRARRSARASIPRSRRSSTPSSRTRRRPCRRSPPACRSHAPAASGCRARAQTPSSRAPAASAAASRRPLSVSGMSVVPVCCPLRLHAVSPCLIANRFTSPPRNALAMFSVSDSSSGSSLRAARHLRQVAQPFERAGGQHVFRAAPAPVAFGAAGHVHPGLAAQVEQVLQRSDRERSRATTTPAASAPARPRTRRLAERPQIAPHVLPSADPAVPRTSRASWDCRGCRCTRPCWDT